MDQSAKILYYKEMGDSVVDIWHYIFDRRVHFPYAEFDLAILEFVSYFPGMGGVSAFTFGGNYYALQMGLIATNIPHQIIRPKVWQDYFKISGRGGSTAKHRAEHKEKIRRYVQRMYPKCELWNEALKIQRACCDAVLLARYARDMSLRN